MVRREDHVREPEQLASHRRLMSEDVQRRGAQPAGAKRADQGILVHHVPSRDVDQDRTPAHASQPIRVDETTGLGGQGHVQGDDVGALEQLVERDDRAAGQLLHVRVAADDLAPEALEPPDDGAPDPTETDDAHAAPMEAPGGQGTEPIPFTASHRSVVLEHAPHGGEDERQRVIGDRLFESTDRARYDDAGLRRRFEVDRVQPHAGSREHAQPRQALEDRTHEGISADDPGARPLHDVHQLLGRSRSDQGPKGDVDPRLFEEGGDVCIGRVEAREGDDAQLSVRIGHSGAAKYGETLEYDHTVPPHPHEALHPLEAARLLRARWLAGETTYGGWIYFRDSFGAEIVARAGLDWVCVDTQHGLARGGDVARLLQAIALAGPVGFVRVPWNEPGVIMNALDSGAAGVFVPLVSNTAEAERAAGACRYPPRGIRSWGPARAALGAPEYSPDWANDRVLCLVMVETEEGVANIDEILAVPGIDAIYIGPSDLALSYDVQREDPANAQRVASLRAACKARRVPVGVAATTVDEARGYAGDGFALVALPSDAVLLTRACAAFIEGIRSESG
jgi:4-hydroxy-2-oxoheptanedioate aldolase